MRSKSLAAILCAASATVSCAPERHLPPFDEPLIAGFAPSAPERSPLQTASSTRTEWRCEDGRAVLYVMSTVTVRNRGSVSAEGLRLVDRTDRGAPDGDVWTGVGGSLEVPLTTLRPGETLEFEYEYPLLGWESAGAYRHSVWVAGEGDGEGETVTVGSDLLSVEPPVDLCAVTCTLTDAYWTANAPGASNAVEDVWPVRGVTLGTHRYDAAELRGILESRPDEDDRILAMAKELIATKLNIAAGADPRDVAAVVRAADALIGNQDLTEGGRTYNPVAATSVAAELARYNAGAAGPGACGASAPPAQNQQVRAERIGMG